MENVATFPNVTVNAGDEYKACILTTKDLELICKMGHNSPAARPEFVNISLDTEQWAQKTSLMSNEHVAADWRNFNEHR